MDETQKIGKMMRNHGIPISDNPVVRVQYRRPCGYHGYKFTLIYIYTMMDDLGLQCL